METNIRERDNKIFIKLQKIVGQIIIIVFSVYVSIWLSNYNEYKKQQTETKAFLIDLKGDLQTDIKNMKEQKQNLDESKKMIATIFSLTRQQLERINNMEMKVQFNTRRNIEANYEGFKSSGKIGTIEDRKLKSNILSYYQENMSITTEMERQTNTIKTETIELMGTKGLKGAALNDPLIRTKLQLYDGLIDSLSKAYADDTKIAQTIITEIDNYTK